jgi:PPP family 3-phenylpropionic acid transporter
MPFSKKINSLYFFILLYGFSYMCNAINGTFLPLYLNSIGYSKTLVGILLSLAPIVAIIGQPTWGILADRSKNKNTVLKLLILGNVVTILFISISDNFFYLLLVLTCFTFFQTSLNPMTDTITLEYSSKVKWHFGHIRLAGTLGYCFMAVLAGFLLKKNISLMFPLYSTFAIATFIIALLLPKVKGHQLDGKKVYLWSLLRDKKLVLYISFALIIQITLGYYNSFFGIYFQSLGASRTLIGTASFISGISEVPFLLFAHRILSKVKIEKALIFAGFASVFRWFFLALSASTYVVLLLQLLHGLIYIVIAVSLATYINNSVPRELKASGQALNAIVGTGISRVIGSLLGGYFSDIFGIRNMFFVNSFFVLLAIIIWSYFFFRTKPEIL